MTTLVKWLCCLLFLALGSGALAQAAGSLRGEPAPALALEHCHEAARGPDSAAADHAHRGVPAAEAPAQGHEMPAHAGCARHDACTCACAAPVAGAHALISTAAHRPASLAIARRDYRPGHVLPQPFRPPIA